ncbi:MULTISPECIES: DUF2147 domain-containing protein [unclassified Paracoccus (in: a-proteobacteria)]|uniref:DUF2147 domain-containing protein n=1 Tax=unclassified Paracoccus (in: a-proteobacteria) TaxID=2688777 RepID=UPI0012B2AAAB|nr:MULTISPECIES: DUF2147 domain-containing protein [unclassified Paracoccus (in: a-proteobacteria)]UXU74004.1 DUF2147 domain-containing protein [Paracoccus sp. SMMA_5]UXU79892.1 DUF2147 domain-containing protein [Paracoccus sp. SMMA_5_TC]
MRKLAFAAALIVAGGAAQAEGISGIFQTQANDDGNVGMVQFYDCGGKYCGKLIKSFDKTGKEIKSPHTGKNIVAGMKDDGNGQFSGGTIWDPGADKTYKSKMTLSGKTLSVSGCIAVFCKTQRWTRVK